MTAKVLAWGTERLLPLVAQVVQHGGAAAGETAGETLVRHVLGVVIFAAIGLVVFAASIWLFVKFSPFSVRKEIEEDQNTALAVIMGAVLIGVSIIIAAAVIG